MKRSELKQLIREVIEEVGGSNASTIYNQYLDSLSKLGEQDKFMDELGSKILKELRKSKIYNMPNTSYSFYPVTAISGPAFDGGSTQLLTFEKLKKSGVEQLYKVTLTLDRGSRKATISVRIWGEQFNAVKEDVTKAEKTTDITDAIIRGIEKLESD
jgi:hypothetical protein